MGIDKLDYFVSAASHCNFSKAARDWGVAQSAISQQIASLEGDINCRLFLRRGRSVVLSRQGQCFFEDAKRLQQMYLHAVEQAKSKVEEALL